MAGIDEPVKKSQETEKAAQDRRCEAANYRTKCHRDVQGNVKSDMPEYGVKDPAEQDGEDS
jgi:hypothetical protein